MRFSEHAASKGAAISTAKKKNPGRNIKKVLPLQIIMIAAIDVVIALAVYCIAKLVCNGISEAEFDSYIKVLFIPLISFLTAFASFVFTKNLSISLLGNIILSIVMFLLNSGFRWNIFLWMILYIVNSLLGYVIAFAARSYKAR